MTKARQATPRSLWLLSIAAWSAIQIGCKGSGGNPPADAGCTPTTCTASAGACGLLPNGCGAMMMCFCPRGQTCGADGIPNRCATTPSDGGPQDAGPQDAGTEPKIGTACEVSSDCGGSPLLCTAGFCTRSCSQASQCSGATVDRSGIYGGQYVCFPLGEGFASFCWPNGSGAQCTSDGGACPRAGELCLTGRCQYPQPGSLAPRSNMKCLRDADCMMGESCALYTNLDDDVRTDGLCLYRGEGDSRRKLPGEACSTFVECGSRRCLVATAGEAGQCSGLCRGNADCPGSLLCSATPLQGALDEFPDQYVGSCNLWEGSRRACGSHAGCEGGESCSVARWFAPDGGTGMVVSGVCRRHPNANGASVGASCSRNADCRGELCLVNPITQLGYCSESCWGGQGECPSGTSCRPRMIDARDPATAADDLRAPFCLQTGLGAVCDFATGCRRCARDDECAPALGWRCAPDGVCRDPLGRCANPCQTGCSVDGGAPRGGCPTGSTCKTVRRDGVDVQYCERTNGSCARLPVDQLLLYDHGRCGDEEVASPQQDLCYFQSRQTVGGSNVDAFLCGQACTASCPDIAVDGGTLATTCRPVYEFGVRSDGGIQFGGYELPARQCAPATSFVGQPRLDGGP